MSSPRIVRLEKSRLLILPGQTVNGCGAVWPSEFFTTLLIPSAASLKALIRAFPNARCRDIEAENTFIELSRSRRIICGKIAD